MKPKAKGGKGKSKAPAAGEPLGGRRAQELQQALEAGQELDDATLLHLLEADAPCEGLYSKACKGKGANPNCLCHLIPQPGAHRRQGLWAKEAEVAGSLGADPGTSAREDKGPPVGLKNLGNTCYVNSVLQCLFANEAFRRAVYAAQPPLADDPVVKELRELFLQMDVGCTSPADPTPLAAALNLDHGVQQDGQEFMKLFLTLLESKLARQPGLAQAIQDLYRGSSGYETRCQQCGNLSESSSRSDSFYEVDVPVKGHASLPESLASLLYPEMMEGDNQYSCEYCGKKTDAMRQLKLRKLPPLLCFSLQRFVFDFQRMDRVKVSDKFAFPLTLDMAAVTDQPKQRGALTYDLEAILVHKGSSAVQGHYVAHIHLGAGTTGSGRGTPAAAAAAAAAAEARAGKGGKAAVQGEPQSSSGSAGGSGWWRFDDESVTELKGGPTRSVDHGGAAVAAKSAAAGAGGEAGSSKKRGRGRGPGGAGGRGRGRGRGKAAAKSEADASEEDEEERGGRAQQQQQQGEEGGSGRDADAQQITSSNAYLLLYRQRGRQLPSVPCDAAESARWVQEQGQRIQGEQAQRVVTYAKAREELLGRQQARQGEVRALLEAAVQLDKGDPGRFVATEWLSSWADGDPSTPPAPIDNSPLLCPHGRLDPAKIGAAKRLSAPAWEQLQSSYKGGPQLGPADACRDCLREKLVGIVAAEDTQGVRDHFLAIAAALEGSSPPAELEPAFLVSKGWLSAWLKRSGRSMGTTSPTAAITCEHGGLAPEAAGTKVRRVGIPSDFWALLQRSWAASLAERRQRERQRQQKAGSGGLAQQQQQQQQQQNGDDDVIEVVDDDSSEVVCIDASPTAAEAERAQQGRPKRRRGANGAATAGDEGGHAVSDSAKEEEEQGAAAETAAAAAGVGGSLGDGTTGSGGEGDALLEFPASCEECPICAVDLSEASRMHQNLQGRRQQERAVLSPLLAAQQPQMLSLEPGATFMLVPTAFMHLWRAYMQQAGKKAGAAKASEVIPPPSLLQSLAGVMCECHSGAASSSRELMLAHPPPAVGSKRGRWVLADSSAAAAEGGPRANGVSGATAGASGGGASGEADPLFEVVSEDDWEGLLEFYGKGSGDLPAWQRQQLKRGISATLLVEGPGEGQAAQQAQQAVALASSGNGDVAGLLADEVLIGDDYMPLRRVQPRTEGRAFFETDPPVCRQAVEARESAARAARLCYTGAEVMVELAGSDEEARAAAPGGVGGGAERKSKRARKGRAPVQVDSMHSVRDLRLRVLEALGVHPANARLYVRGQLLEVPDETTLAECEIFPGEEIRVVDTQEHDADDMSGLFPGGAGGRRAPREAELGFTGTALTGFTPGGDAADGGAAEGQGAEADGGSAVAEGGAGEGQEAAPGEEEAAAAMEEG